MLTERIEETAPRALMHSHPAEKWQFVRVARGWEARAWTDVNALTPAERAEYDEGLLRAEYHVQYGPPEEAAPIWPSLALAKEFAALCDYEENIDEDLRAFGAPGECYDDAHRAFERKHDALMAQAVTEPATTASEAWLAHRADSERTFGVADGADS